MNKTLLALAATLFAMGAHAQAPARADTPAYAPSAQAPAGGSKAPARKAKKGKAKAKKKAAAK